MKSKREQKERIIGYCFVLPAVIYMLALIGYPIIYNWIISFQDVTATTLGSAVRDFVGFENFKAVFADPTFPKAIFLYDYVFGVSVFSGIFVCPVLLQKIQLC